MPLYTVNEIALRLRASRSLVYRLINRGELRSHRIGGRIRIAEADLVEFLDKARQGSPRTPPPHAPRRRLKHLRL